jgi:hypothetical protein
MEHEKVDEEFVTVNVESILPADVGKALAEFAKEAIDLCDERRFKLALGGWSRELNKLKVVRIAGDLLHQFGVVSREQSLKVGWRRARPLVQLRHDLVLKNRPRPTVLDRLPGIPNAGCLLVKPVEQKLVVAPGQFPHKL